MDRFDSTGNLFQSNSIVLFYPVNSSCFRLFGLAITLRNLETVKRGMLKSNWVRLKNRSLFTDVVLFFFSFFSKTSDSARASARTSAESGERRASNFVFPHPYPLALAVNKSPAVFCFLSRALDGLRRENRGSVNRLEKSLLWLHNMNIYIMIAHLYQIAHLSDQAQETSSTEQLHSPPKHSSFQKRLRPSAPTVNSRVTTIYTLLHDKDISQF